MACRDLRVKSLPRHVTYPWEPKIVRCSNALLQSGQNRHRGRASHLGRRLLSGFCPVSRLPCSRFRRAPSIHLATMSESLSQKVLHTTPRFIARRQAGPSMSRRLNALPRPGLAVRPVGWMGWLGSTSISSRRVWDIRRCARTAVPARVGSIGTHNAGWKFLFIPTFAHTFTECSVTR